MRRLRINAPAQLSLELGDAEGDRVLWWSLPERARAETLGVLAGMIAADVIADRFGDGLAGHDGPGVGL